MMDRMRALSQGWGGRFVMAVILGFIIISFGFWGIGDVFRGSNGSDLAEIGSTHITVAAFRDAYQNELQAMQQKAKRGISNDEARRLGLDRQVLARLLTDAVLDQEAKKLGLAVGDADIAKAIYKDDSFKGSTGQFDKTRFDYVMRQNGLTEARYVDEQRKTDLRVDISEAVIGGIETPKAMAEAIHRYQTETRAVDYITLPPSAAGEIAKPADAEIQKYYDDRKGAYLAPEYRKLLILSVVPADLVKPDAVSDADVRKRYDETKATMFTVPEKRAIEQIVFPSEDEAKAAKAKLDAGESFDALAAERKLSTKDIDLGLVTKGQIADKAVEEAAFALGENTTSQPVKTQFGAVLVHVGTIDAMKQQALIDVSAQLKDQIAIIRAKAEATRLRDKIEEQRSAGKTLSEAAASVGLTPRTIEAIDAQGRDKPGRPVESIVDGPAVLKAAFASDVGADTEMITTANGGFVWYEVAGIEAARQLSLSDVRPQVEAAWRGDAVAKALAAKSDAIVKALDGGQTMAAVAGAQGNLKVDHTGDVRRGGSPALPQNAVAGVFAIGVHKAGSSSTPGGGRIVYQVLDGLVPPLDAENPEFKKIIAQVKSSMLDDVLGQYLARLQQDFGVKINTRALAGAVGADANGDAGGS